MKIATYLLLAFISSLGSIGARAEVAPDDSVGKYEMCVKNMTSDSMRGLDVKISESHYAPMTNKDSSFSPLVYLYGILGLNESGNWTLIGRTNMSCFVIKDPYKSNKEDIKNMIGHILTLKAEVQDPSSGSFLSKKTISCTTTYKYNYDGGWYPTYTEVVIKEDENNKNNFKCTITTTQN